MFDRIDIYIKRGARWTYVEGTRMHKTLAAAERHYAEQYGVAVKARWSA